jgi:hypothetical protein
MAGETPPYITSANRISCSIANGTLSGGGVPSNGLAAAIVASTSF